ncbi:MAG: HD domain-containing protein [Nitrospirota bacterium]|nr:HD domain-containing protein [Nitrospirota bacterium]
MNEINRTREQLENENAALSRRVCELEREKSLHEQTQKELLRVTRALKALSICNRTLMRAENVSGFLKQICCDIISQREYRLAWIGFAEHDEQKTVRPVAQCGYEEGYLDTVNITWADTERGQGPTGTAIRTGKPVIAKDIPTNQTFAPWRAEAVKRGYASSIALPLISGKRILGSLNIYAAEPDAFDADEVNLLTELGNNVTYGIGALEMRAKREQAEAGLKESLGKLKKALNGTIYALTEILQRRDPYTAGHQERVAELACAIAREMGLSEDRIEGIRMAGLLHDIGKIHVPYEILARPGRISDLETDIIETHARVGYEILKTIEFPWPVLDTILQHQERLDGSGYPAGLSGDRILLEARILAVADVVEAMSSHRPYRPTLGMDMALKEISDYRDIRYDADAVDACLRLFNEKGYRII